ncbi:MAG: GreA/GreB family elongation factor [Patescibacteria group bacterium]
MKDKEYYLTPEGLQKYKEEYKKLRREKKEKRIEMRESRDDLWRPEDLNPDYEAIMGDLGFIERRLKDLENIFRNVRLIRKPRHSPGRVILGSKVFVQSDGKKDEFTLVGTLEANPSEGKISIESPIGKNLLGHKVGENIAIEYPLKINYKILKISSS